MKKLTILLSFLFSVSSYAICVEERSLTGSAIKNLEATQDLFIYKGEGIYLPSSEVEIDDNKSYFVQMQPKKSLLKNSDDYNDKYIEYYTYERIQKYLTEKKELIEKLGMEVTIVGKSLGGRNLYAIKPKSLSQKKTIVMFGRHHGDEGTANWIIEGFFDEYLNNPEFNSKYQLILYPMINPDGATHHTRYNNNNRDLNRTWHKNINRTKDETFYIHKDLKDVFAEIQKHVFIVLDMHGSIREDFIYRVKKDYVSLEFYNHQQNFIDELGIYDPWQKGNFILSNGEETMARIVLINHYKLNAMTHESIKNIPLDNGLGRTKETLIDQGLAIVKSISNLY